MFNLDRKATIDELEQRLLAWEAMISALRQQQAATLASLDTMQVRQIDGSRSLQEWTRGRLDVSAHTARNLVNAARSLPNQPELVQLAADNAMSFERLIATSKLVATGADEEAVADSFHFDLAGVARLQRRRRRINRTTESEVFADRHVYLQDSLDGTRGRFGGELPGFEYRILAKALEERADLFADLPGPRIGKPQRMADAIVSVAQDSLELPNPEGDTIHRSDPLVTVLVDGRLADETRGEAGAEIEFGPRVGPAVLEQILCQGRVQLVGVTDGKPVAVTDGTRSIPPAVRRIVAWRDGACTIDGCHSRYRLQPHHIRPRAAGGSHEPHNLTTLCWFHHHVVIHRLGYSIDLDSPSSADGSDATTAPGPTRRSGWQTTAVAGGTSIRQQSPQFTQSDIRVGTSPFRTRQ